MAELNPTATQDTLDTLRATRRRLYAIPEGELGSMSLDDQAKYGKDLHEVGLAILRLETAKMRGVNEGFKEKEAELHTAAAKLEQDTAKLQDAAKFIRAVSEGLGVVTRVVGLLA